MPAPTAWRLNAACIQRLGDGAQRRSAGLSNFANDRQDIARRAVGFSLDGRHGLNLRGLDMGIAELNAFRFSRRQCRPRAPGDQGTLLFGESRVEVQGGRDRLPAPAPRRRKARDAPLGRKWNARREGETVELGDCDGAPQRPSLGEGRRQLRPAIKCVASFASLDLDELGDISNPSAAANRASASLCASMPRPDRPCWLVLTRM